MARHKYKAGFEDRESQRFTSLIAVEAWHELHKLSADRRSEGGAYKIRDLIEEGLILLFKNENTRAKVKTKAKRNGA